MENLHKNMSITMNTSHALSKHEHANILAEKKKQCIFKIAV